MSIIPQLALKDRLKMALFAQEYSSLLSKYGKFIPKSEAAIAAVDELVSLALLNRRNKRSNCRIAKLIMLINHNDDFGVAKLISSVGREAAEFERAAYLAEYRLAKQSDNFYQFEPEEKDCFLRTRIKNAEKENENFENMLKNGEIKIGRDGQLRWDFD